MGSLAGVSPDQALLSSAMQYCIDRVHKFMLKVQLGFLLCVSAISKAGSEQYQMHGCGGFLYHAADKLTCKTES